MSDPLWTPSDADVQRANLTAFLRLVESRYRPGLADYASLYRWSIEEPALFWTAVWKFCSVVASREADEVLVDGDQMPGARWFVGARLNFAENLLRYRDDQPALVLWNESGPQRRLSYAELYDQVARLAESLREAGVQPGDRVAGYLPNIPEAVIAMLAATSLGTVWSSTSPDFGVQGVLDRFGQIEPKVLFTADGYRYAGQAFDSLARVKDVCREIPSIRTVVVVPILQQTPALDPSLAGVVLWDDFLAADAPPSISFAQLPFDQPAFILYSSGTTGAPKCIVHGAGGTLLQHLKELALHTDVQRSDRIFYFTTCGWMMWNWLVSSLACGATVLLYDGAPMSPEPDILFRLAELERMTIFGTSPRYLTAVEKAGLEPGRDHDLSLLRAMLSTGAPLAGSNFDFVYRHVRENLRLSSISGGTDICSCFALGNPLGPVYRGELQTRGLGMKVFVYDDQGRPVQQEKGELVCAAPFPAMPLGFWNDPDGSRYRQTYFERYPGVWWHGDFAELTEHDGMIIYGRSDAVLNPGGVRIGTAEIYRQVERLPEIKESVVIGQDWQGDVRVVLFVKLQEGVSLDESLRARIKQQIRANTTPRHVPAKILQVADIPHTRSGKIVELAVRDVVHGRSVKNREALTNPESLELFRDLPELAN